MKRVLAILCVVLMLGLSMGCGNARTIRGVYHDTYGLFTQDNKDPNVCYRLIVGNLVWSVLTIETIILPIYFVGFSLWEPVPSDDCVPYNSSSNESTN